MLLETAEWKHASTTAARSQRQEDHACDHASSYTTAHTSALQCTTPHGSLLSDLSCSCRSSRSSSYMLEEHRRPFFRRSERPCPTARDVRREAHHMLQQAPAGVLVVALLLLPVFSPLLCKSLGIRQERGRYGGPSALVQVDDAFPDLISSRFFNTTGLLSALQRDRTSEIWAWQWYAVSRPYLVSPVVRDGESSHLRARLIR